MNVSEMVEILTDVAERNPYTEVLIGEENSRGIEKFTQAFGSGAALIIVPETRVRPRKVLTAEEKLKRLEEKAAALRAEAESEVA